MIASNLESNRRKAYRVRPAPGDRLSVALFSDEQRHVPDEVSDITLNGAAVRFLGDNGPALAAGDRVSLSVESPELDGGANLVARIVSTDETRKSSSFHLLFEQNDDLVNRGNSLFFQLFNRRAAFRGVEPEPDHDLNAQVRPIAGAYESSVSFPVNLRNISTTGACLDVDVPADTYLRLRAQFQLSLTLPNRGAKHDIESRVCYRTEDGAHVYYGCRFEWDPTSKSLDTIEDLAEYMLDQFEEQMPDIQHDST